jgi:protein-glucosylgalactosylhydroxylysine glucosidase
MKLKVGTYCVYFFVLALFFQACNTKEQISDHIDRLKLVSRHNVLLQDPDTLGSLSVGNGEFAFTVDVTGLQTFPDEYANGIPLGTQSQWAWHSMPSKNKYYIKDVAHEFESCDGTKAPYAVQQSEGPGKEATDILRANPHRLHLGLIGLILVKENGDEVKLEELTDVQQQLDLWTGKIESTFKVEGVPVKVIVYSHQQKDRIAAKIESPLIEKERLRIKFSFPYGKDCHVCPGYDWDSTDKHMSEEISAHDKQSVIKRVIDTTTFFTHISWIGDGNLNRLQGRHTFVLSPARDGNTFEFTATFARDSTFEKSDFVMTESNSVEHWKQFWNSGAAIDFSECTDPRAKELERRVVLSQYLTKIQCTGSMPPQETGLTMNSWYGKFHLEMHWWHAAHFALWDRAEWMNESLKWYTTVTEKAKATAQWQGYEGARWQKMTDPYGNESPSNIGAFIIWQQPHPIYLAELLYRNDSSEQILHDYKDLVFNTADFMASFVKLKDGKYHLCHPLIPAQEIFKATVTDDPAYELQYWYYGLLTAQKWRERLGLPLNEKWNNILANLVPLAVKDDLYLPTATTPDAYTDRQFRRDHPAVVGAYGFLPWNNRIDTVVMAKTFDNIMNDWQWDTTWGWDYPLLAMTAARLSRPEQAINALLMDIQKNTYLVNGHNYQDQRLRLYLPGNGGLLAAVAMMAGGWDGNKKRAPGFPDNGMWNVKWEGFKPMP